jgi:hypothetical protein
MEPEFYTAARSFPYRKFITKGTEMRRAQGILSGTSLKQQVSGLHLVALPPK